MQYESVARYAFRVSDITHSDKMSSAPPQHPGYVDTSPKPSAWDVHLRPGFNPWKAYVSFGLFFFVALNAAVKRFAVPLPETASRQQKWKWCNILVSLVHSTMTGLAAPVVFYLDPALQVSAHDHTAHHAAAVSTDVTDDEFSFLMLLAMFSSVAVCVANPALATAADSLFF